MKITCNLAAWTLTLALAPACATHAPTRLAAHSPALLGESSAVEVAPVNDAGAPEVQQEIVPAGAPGTFRPADPAEADEWRFAVVPYVWAIALNGSVRAKGVKAKVDMDFQDVLDVLDAAVLVVAEARKGEIVLRLDQQYMSVSESAKTNGLRAEADMDLYMGTFKVGTPITDEPDAPLVFVGTRYWNFSTRASLKTGGVTLASGKDSTSWWDPLVGAEATLPIDDKWSILAAGEVGGFGIGDASDSTWGASLLASRKSDNGDNFLIGWRYLTVDKTEGSGAGKTELDVSMSGPIVGYAFRF